MIWYHGEQRTVDFSVSNFDEDKINEVLLSFYFTIDSGTEIPLTYELYEIISGTPQKIDFANEKSSTIELGYGPTKITKDFQLKIIWDASNNSLDYANKSVNYTIKLQAEQVV